ncbi:MAG: pyridoxamine 5'-phosphate oxidase family protein, partial [Actinomycetota bacterium]|nr:pyridoxamine 5'-phosphate oxidase family protein [Actinomycetota bacterium]
MVKRPRRLEPGEIDSLISLDVPARLATLDQDGFPHVTPLWFVWADGAFFMTSIADRPHVRRLSHDCRAGLCIDVEDPERTDGQRP